MCIFKYKLPYSVGNDSITMDIVYGCRCRKNQRYAGLKRKSVAYGQNKQGSIFFCLLSLLITSPAMPQSAGQSKNLEESSPPVALHTVPVRPATAEAEQELHSLQTLDYSRPAWKEWLKHMNLKIFLHKFDIIIKNGFTQEAGAEMQRLAAEELGEDPKRALAEEVFNAHVRVLEHAEPLGSVVARLSRF